MQISVSSTLTLFHDGQFWVGIIEHVEGGKLSVARIVFGAGPSDEEVLWFVIERWQALMLSGSQVAKKKRMAKDPKCRQREVSKALKQPADSTKAQMTLAEQREALRQESSQARKQIREEKKQARFEQRSAKHKEKRREH